MNEWSCSEVTSWLEMKTKQSEIQLFAQVTSEKSGCSHICTLFVTPIHAFSTLYPFFPRARLAEWLGGNNTLVGLLVSLAPLWLNTQIFGTLIHRIQVFINKKRWQIPNAIDQYWFLIWASVHDLKILPRVTSIHACQLTSRSVWLELVVVSLFPDRRLSALLLLLWQQNARSHHAGAYGSPVNRERESKPLLRYIRATPVYLQNVGFGKCSLEVFNWG